MDNTFNLGQEEIESEALNLIYNEVARIILKPLKTDADVQHLFMFGLMQTMMCLNGEVYKLRAGETEGATVQ